MECIWILEVVCNAWMKVLPLFKTCKTCRWWGCREVQEVQEVRQKSVGKACTNSPFTKSRTVGILDAAPNWFRLPRLGTSRQASAARASALCQHNFLRNRPSDYLTHPSPLLHLNQDTNQRPCSDFKNRYLISQDRSPSVLGGGQTKQAPSSASVFLLVPARRIYHPGLPGHQIRISTEHPQLRRPTYS